MIFTDFRIGNTPQNSIERHKKRLGEDPRQVHRLRGYLLPMHPDIEAGRIEADLRRSNGWL